jgi:hypothetical protein
VRYAVTPRPLELFSLLTRHGVSFVVVGGYAVIFHGHMRATEDVDIIWLRSPQAESALLSALTEANARWISDEVDPATKLEKLVPVTADYISSRRLMMLVTDFGFLDLFDYVPGVPEADVQVLFAESIQSDDLRYVSLPWLKEMKRAAGRPRDAEDLENLK